MLLTGAIYEVFSLDIAIISMVYHSKFRQNRFTYSSSIKVDTSIILRAIVGIIDGGFINYTIEMFSHGRAECQFVKDDFRLMKFVRWKRHTYR
jgi:hypothetical protein